jgi:anti-sigma factor (TIGR02949 family)
MRHRGDDCDKAVHALYNYLDGEMGLRQKRHLMGHLRRCRGCSDAADFERTLLSRIRQACPQEPPPELVERLRRLLQQAGDE